MITSFEVGSIFKVVDQVTPELRKMSAALMGFGSELKGVEKLVSSLGKMKFTGTMEALKGLNLGFAKVGEASALAKTAVLENFAKADVGIGGTIKEVGRLNRMLAETKTAMNGMRVPGGGGGGHNRPGHRGFGFGGDHMAVAIGGAFTAEGIIHGMVDAGKDAAELRHIQEQMRQAGISAPDIAAATSASWNIGGKLGLPVADVMRDVKELRQPFGSVEETLKFLEPLEKMRVVLNTVSEGKGTSSRDAVYEMVRAGELKGLNDPAEYMKYFDDMTKVISASGGKVGPREFMQATKYSRLAALGYNQEFYTKYLPTLIQGLGASGAGTAGSALFGTLIQGKATGRAVLQMDSLGLIGDRSKLRYNKAGDAIGFNSGAIKDTDKLLQNPFQWVKEDLLPMIEKKYGDITTDKGRTAAVKALGDVFGNRMSAQDAGEFLLRMKSFDRDAKLNAGAIGLGGAEELQSKDPTAAWAKLVGSFTNFMTALGEPMIGPAVKCMNMLSDGLKVMTDWAQAHPDAVKNIAAGLAGAAAALGVAAVAAGVALLGSGGAIAVAATTIAGVVTGLAAVNWQTLADGLSAFWEKVKGFLPQFTPAIPKDGGASLLEQSYKGGGMFGGSLINAAFGGAANDNAAKIVAGTIAGGITNSNVIVMGAGGGLGDFASGGSFGGGRRGFMGGGPVRPLVGKIPNGEYSELMRATSLRLGIDPNVSLRVYGHEGRGSYVGDGGSSFGPLQLHYGGINPRMPHAGLGEEFDKYMHRYHAAMDPSTVPQQIEFGLRHVRKHGWGAWMGARAEGIYGFRGVGPMPSAGAPPPRRDEHHHHLKVFLDKKEITAEVTKEQTRVGQFPTAVGAMDTHGSFASPGTPLFDVA